MRLHEIANDWKQPVIVYHPECGNFLLMPDCQLLDLDWCRLNTTQKIRFDSQWEPLHSPVLG